MGKIDLQSFINTKKQHILDEGSIDWSAQRDVWLDHLNALYKQIEIWLKAFENNDVISFEYQDVILNEEHLGVYSARKMMIKIAGEHITLEPIGTLLIGAKGRVDMQGKNGVVKFVLVSKVINSPVIKVNDEPSQKFVPKNKEEWVWKIATPPPGIQYVELHDDSFSDALLSVAGG